MHQRIGDGDGSAVTELGRASSELAGLLEDAELWRLPDRQVVAGVAAAYRLEGAAVRTGLATGEVQVDQAGVIATALLELPDDASTSTRVLAEELLVGEAAMHGPVALARLGHRIAERVDPDAADRRIAVQLAREEREARRLRSGTRFTDGHGSVFSKFRVPVGDDAFIWPILDTLRGT